MPFDARAFKTYRCSIKGFWLQLEALKNLLDAEVSFHPALTMSFSSTTGVRQLKAKLAEIDQGLVDNLEEEYAILYPPFVERLKKAGVEPKG